MTTSNFALRKVTNGGLFPALLLSNCTITRETEKAVLVVGESNAVGSRNGDLMEGWLPKSVLTFDGDQCFILPTFSKASFKFL